MSYQISQFTTPKVHVHCWFGPGLVKGHCYQTTACNTTKGDKV